MGKIKAKVIKQFKQFEGILDIGDIIEIEPMLAKKKKLMIDATYKNDPETYAKVLVNPEIWASIGNFEGYRFKAKNGGTYTDDWITNAIGHVDINVLLEKIN